MAGFALTDDALVQYVIDQPDPFAGEARPGEEDPGTWIAGGYRTTRAAAALPQQMQSALSDVAQALLLPGTVGSALGHGAGALIKALRERRQSVRALAGCSRLADLLEAEPDLEALSFYPHLLAWDLAQLPAGKSALPVILLDTFEDTGDRTHRDFERLLQRVVWLMPNAFFVVTGRSRLQWAEASLEGQLDWTGPNAWPGLVPDTAHTRSSASRRQILIGDFSPEDCEDYLARRLSRDGQPLIDEPVCRIIAERSHGLPLYLDLSVMRYLELRRGRRQPRVTDFDHDFPALIARTLSDLTAEERHVLRSVSLLNAFSVPLATQVAGMDHDAPALRLTERPFIRDSPSGVWPFHIRGAAPGRSGSLRIARAGGGVTGVGSAATGDEREHQHGGGNGDQDTTGHCTHQVSPER